MDIKELERLLGAFKRGELDEAEAARRVSNLHFEDLGHARVDHARAARQGFPEVVFGAGKTRAQVCEIVEALARRAPNLLVTRTDEETFGEVRNVCTEAEWHPAARMIRVQRDRAARREVRERALRVDRAGGPRDRDRQFHQWGTVEQPRARMNREPG